MQGNCAPWGHAAGSSVHRAAGSPLAGGWDAGAAGHGQSPQHVLSSLSWGMGLQPHPHDSRTPPWPRWSPSCARSQLCPMARCSTAAGPHSGSLERLQRWKSPSKSLLPSQQGKHPLATLTGLWWPAETEMPAPLPYPCPTTTGATAAGAMPAPFHLPLPALTHSEYTLLVRWEHLRTHPAKWNGTTGSYSRRDPPAPRASWPQKPGSCSSQTGGRCHLVGLWCVWVLSH